MKKFLNLITFVIISIALTLIFSFISEEVFAETTDITARGIPANMSLTIHTGSPAIDQWIDCFKHADWLCSQPGYPMGSKSTNMQVIMFGTVGGKAFSVSASDPTRVSGEKALPITDTWSSPPDITLNIGITGGPMSDVSSFTNFAGPSSGSTSGKAGITNTQNHGAEATAYSGGTTVYTNPQNYVGHFGLPFNNKYAVTGYILSECNNDNGLMPRQSYVNLAYWSTLTNGYNAYKKIPATFDVHYADGSYQPKTVYYDKTHPESFPVSQNVPGATESATTLWDEALTFAGMWKIIEAQGGTGLNKTVFDETDTSKVYVEFDAAKNRYRVGPFKLNYLEKYTDINGTMLCGMGALPKLKVNVDGKTKTYSFVDKNELGSKKQKFTITYNGTRNENNIPVKYRNLLPHTKEDFYIEFNYEEGINSIKELEFYFRYLDVNCSFSVYEANIGRATWKSWIEVKRENGVYKNPVLHWGNTVTEASVDVQDPAYVHYAERSFRGSSYGDANVRTGDVPVVIRQEIDLTTTLGGHVWRETPAQKNNNYITGFFELETVPVEEQELGVNNVLITVYIYQGDKKLGKAIMHDNDGNRIEWPYATPSNGHYQFTRVEPPATNDKNNCFYVVEFEYDGQRYRHTPHFAYIGQDIYNPDSSLATETNDGTTMWRIAPQVTKEEYYKECLSNAVNPANSRNYIYKYSSNAVENYSERLAFDESFGQITGNQSINNNGETTGYTVKTGADGTGGNGKAKTLKYNQVSSSGQVITSEVDSPFNKHRKVEIRPVNNSEYDMQYRMMATTFASDVGGTSDPLSEYQLEYPIRQTNGDRKWILNTKCEESRIRIGKRHYIAGYMIHINLGLIDRAKTDMSVLKDLYGVTMVVNEQKVTQPYLYLRDKSKSDYNTMSNLLFEKKNNKYSLGLYSSDVAYQSYQRYQHAIDEVYNIKEGSELRLYATYVVRVYNNSQTNDVEVNRLTDYYDNTFTLVDSDRYAPIVDEKLHRNSERVADRSYYRIMNYKDSTNNNNWRGARELHLAVMPEDTTGYNRQMTGYVDWTIGNDVNGMHSASTNTLTNIKLRRDEYVEIFTTYEIDFNGYQAMQDKNAEGLIAREKLFSDKTNIAEISNYSTYYSEYDSTKYYSGYSIKNVSGKVDKDSAPNNIVRTDLNDETKYEDDTFKAILLDISMSSVERKMNGTVFNDEKTVDTGKYNIKTGDGKLGDNDSRLSDVEVSMYEVINLGSVAKDINGSNQYNTTYDGYDYYYKVPNEFYNDSEDIVKTGADGTYHLNGFLAGDYVIRFDYGKYKDDGNVYKFNGQDYENTAFIVDNPEGLNRKYLDISGKELDLSNNYSVARDNESRRMVVDSYSRTIENERGELLRDRNSSEYQEATRMFAETPIMQIEVLDPKYLIKKELGKNDYFEKYKGLGFGFDSFEYTINNINFGIEERAKTNITLEQYVNKIMMYKNDEPVFMATMNEDGTIIVNATDATNLDKVSYIPHIEATRPDLGLYQQGFYSISIEEEFLNGLDIYMKYKIRVLNKSDVDFTGKLSNFHVAKDIVKRANQTPTYPGAEELTAWIADDNDIALGLSSNSTLTEILTYNDSELAALLARDSNRNRIQTSENQDGSGNEAMIYGGDSIRPQVIIYGKYVGRYYYQNTIDENDKTYTISNYEGHGENTRLADIDVRYTGDRIVKTVVDQLVDYIDNDASFAEDSISIDGNWSTQIERANDGEPIRVDDNGPFKTYLGIISKEDIGGESGAYRFVNNKLNLYDNKDRGFVGTNKSNIAISYNERLKNLDRYRENYTNYTTYLDQDYLETGRREYIGDDIESLFNSGLTRYLVPENYKNNGGTQEGDTQAEMYITLSKHTQTGSDANQLDFDNLAEVLVYSNTVGRRDTTSVPGNALKIATREGMWAAGYNSFNPDKEYNPSWMEPEDDAYTPEVITSIPPNGLPMRTYIKNYIIPITILIVMLSISVSLFGFKQVKIIKNKEIEY